MLAQGEESSTGRARPAKRPRSIRPGLTDAEAEIEDEDGVEGTVTRRLRKPGMNLPQVSEAELCEVGASGSDLEHLPPSEEPGWCRVPTAAERAVRKAQRDVERMKKVGSYAPNTRNHYAGGGREGFEVVLRPTTEGASFVGVSLLKLYEELRSKLSGAHARVHPKGWLIVRVPSLEQVTGVRQLTAVLGIEVSAMPTEELPLWGRITGVNPSFTEQDLLDVLQAQGVEKVIREKYNVKEVSANGEVKKVERPSRRVRLLFKDRLVPHVTIAFERFPVVLCPASPLQCVTCCRFGHKAADCTRRGNAVCRRCGMAGHQMWECSQPPRCINCRGHHPANDKRCQVFATYARAASERYTNKILASIPNSRVDAAAAVASVEEPSDEHNRPSFAAVTARGSSRVIIQKTEEGDATVCHVPRDPPRKKEHLRAAVASLPKSDRRDTALEQRPKDKPATGALTTFLSFVKSVWPVLKELLQPLLLETPWLEKLLDILTSDAVLSLLQSHSEVLSHNLRHA